VLLIPERHGQTDRQTDRRLTVASPRSVVASRGKNSRNTHQLITACSCSSLTINDVMELRSSWIRWHMASTLVSSSFSSRYISAHHVMFTHKRITYSSLKSIINEQVRLSTTLFRNFGDKANIIIRGMLSLLGLSVIPKCIVLEYLYSVIKTKSHYVPGSHLNKWVFRSCGLPTMKLLSLRLSRVFNVRPRYNLQYMC